MTIDSKCSLCGNHIATISHVLRECFLDTSVWTLLVRSDMLMDATHLPMEEWIFANMPGSSKFACNVDSWGSTFGAIFWCLWKNCNVLFNSSYINVEGIIEKTHRFFGKVMEMQQHIKGIDK